MLTHLRHRRSPSLSHEYWAWWGFKPLLTITTNLRLLLVGRHETRPFILSVKPAHPKQLMKRMATDSLFACYSDCNMGLIPDTATTLHLTE